jgi:hypothetical protein
MWIKQINDYKLLNNAKFTILNKMATNIAFSDSLVDQRISFCPFEKEWISLEKDGAVEKIKKINLIAFKSSNMEYLIPKAFFVIFVLILLFTIGISIFNWEIVVNSSQLKISNSSYVGLHINSI